MHTLTSVLDGDKWSGSHTGHFMPVKESPLHTEQEAEWGTGPEHIFWIRGTSLAPVSTQLAIPTQPACSLK